MRAIFGENASMRRGVLFSLMVFLMVSALLVLFQANQIQDRTLKSALTEENAFRKVSDKFDNIRNAIVVLSGNDTERSVDQRILPFTYDIDVNRVSFTFDIPMAQRRTETYLEAVNAARIFFEDTNYGKEFDGLRVDVNTLTPSTWGGTDTNISFQINPQCVIYKIQDSNIASFEMGCDSYDYNRTIRRHDVNLMLSTTQDFNTISCFFNGSGVCFDSDFNSLDSRPYLNVELVDSNCTKCALSQKKVRGHFNPNITSTISVSCAGNACITPSLLIGFSNTTSFHFSGDRFSVKYAFDLNSEIEEFIFRDVNIGVHDPIFGAGRWQ